MPNDDAFPDPLAIRVRVITQTRLDPSRIRLHLALVLTRVLSAGLDAALGHVAVVPSVPVGPDPPDGGERLDLLCLVWPATPTMAEDPDGVLMSVMNQARGAFSRTCLDYLRLQLAFTVLNDGRAGTVHVEPLHAADDGAAPMD